MVMSPMAGPRQVPESATGGESIPAAVSSIANLRTVIGTEKQGPLTLGGTQRIEISNVGYAKCYRFVITGTLDVASGTGSVTAGDPRKILKQISFNVQSSTNLHTADGVVENFLNELDTRVVSPKAEFTINEGANTFYMEWTVWLPFTEANLAGIIYKGGGSTYPTVQVSTGIVDDIVALTGDASASFSAFNFALYEERLDARAPRNPEEVIVERNGEEVEETIPGKGLWRETSVFIESGEDKLARISGPNQREPVELQLGQPYLRILMVSYLDNQVDVNDELLRGYEILLENTTKTMAFDVDHSDMLFRKMYNKNRPGGLHVVTFIDRTASDRDVMYTRDLGNFELVLLSGDGVPLDSGSGNYVQIYTQKLRKLTTSAAY